MQASEPAHVAFQIEESAQIPALGKIFGWAAMLPFADGAIAVWLLPDAAPAVALTILWGGAVLLFLAGVRRGLSFRTPGGEDAAQIATMLGWFLLALAALVSPLPAALLVLLIAGYVSAAVLDPLAARRREAPLFFARLRPVQMLVPIASLGAVLLHLLLIR
jgi:hypothetical protein